MDTNIGPAPFKLALPAALTFEPEHMVPVSPNYTAYVYRQDRDISAWHEGVYHEDSVEQLYVVPLHNLTGETPDDYEDGRWVNSAFEAMIEIRRIARGVREREENQARMAAEEARGD